jgi:hypothetical protein
MFLGTARTGFGSGELAMRSRQQNGQSMQASCHL